MDDPLPGPLGIEGTAPITLGAWARYRVNKAAQSATMHEFV